jgi:hypothetical protein
MLLLAPAAGGVLLDDTAPEVTPRYFGPLKPSGWYTGDVIVNWLISDPDGPILGWTQGCNPAQLTAETVEIKLTCTAWSAGGSTTIETKPIRIDKTAPSVTAVLERQPDANGWYNRPFTVAFVGSDATSKVASCSSMHYSGPDSSAASAAGSCSDNAGNVAQSSFAFKYDATPPSVFSVTATHGNRSAQLSWRKSSDTKVIEVFRTPGRNGQGESGIYRGTANGVKDNGLVVGRKYEYRVIGVDEAANRAEQKLGLVATGALLSPTPGLQITMKSPPALAWARAKGATYYNIQLIYKGRKVLSAWPQRPSYRLRRTWLYRGRRYRLQPGVYRWYVWPGYGRISAARYAKRPLGSSSFVVTK